MKLQLALDDISLPDAISLGDRLREYVDIMEIGTPFIIEHGMAPVREFKARFPGLEVFADTKIMDAGEYAARSALAAGVSVKASDGCTATVPAPNDRFVGSGQK